MVRATVVLDNICKKAGIHSRERPDKTYISRKEVLILAAYIDSLNAEIEALTIGIMAPRETDSVVATH